MLLMILEDIEVIELLIIVKHKLLLIMILLIKNGKIFKLEILFNYQMINLLQFHFYLFILFLKINLLFKADIVILSTSEDNGLCYIETAELDG